MNVAKEIYCKQIECDTYVCDWYECPYGAQCEIVKKFYKFIQTNDDPDDVQLIDGTLFYSPDSITAPQLDVHGRAAVYTRWEREQ